MLALIAGTVSYLHMHLLVELHGQPGWVAALTPLSVDGVIVAASTTLLADSRRGSRGGFAVDAARSLHFSDRQNVVYAAAAADVMPRSWKRTCMPMRRVS
jgi:hypothetical protein